MELVQKYIEQKIKLQNNILSYLDNPNSDENDFYELVDFLKKQNINAELDHFLGMIINISNEHHREPGFFNKIDHILLLYKDEIKKSKSNVEIFEQFKSNRRVVLFLLKEKILILDKYIINMMEEKIYQNGTKYSDFFIPEICGINNDDDLGIIDYENKRQIGENDTYICSLIRQDLVEEFIVYVTKNNISLSSRITPSIFETNSLFLTVNPMLIYYAAFFGSIQIFQYLYMNNVNITNSLFYCGIYSNNSIFIHHYVENKIDKESVDYKSYVLHSIECHHNELANYILDNYINDDNDNDDDSLLFPKKSFKEQIIEKAFKSSIQTAANENRYDVIYYLLSNEEEIKENFFKENDKLKKIVIPPSIKYIEENSFYACRSLRDISISSSVLKIGKNSFSYCHITDIIIPSLISIEPGTFSFCPHLVNITMTSSVKKIGKGAFKSCILLREIKLSPSLVAIENETFKDCSSLYQIYIPSFVEYIGRDAFSGCSKLTKIEFNLKESHLISIDSAFRDCKSLETIHVPDSVRHVDYYAFFFCKNLKCLILPNAISRRKLFLPDSLSYRGFLKPIFRKK